MQVPLGSISGSTVQNIFQNNEENKQPIYCNLLVPFHILSYDKESTCWMGKWKLWEREEIPFVKLKIFKRMQEQFWLKGRRVYRTWYCWGCKITLTPIFFSSDLKVQSNLLFIKLQMARAIIKCFFRNLISSYKLLFIFSTKAAKMNE